jgi:anhydro-N-acetylmuramic acid kinase
MAGLYIGLISGTSRDGIDAALVRLDDTGVSIVDALCVPYDATLARTLGDLIQAPSAVALDAVGQLDAAIGEAFARAARELLAHCGQDARDVTAIGSHGQTIRHSPDLDPPFTWQVGDPNIIAARTGITTVADFRRRDVALGGQGAPLVPLFHAAAFGDRREQRAILNLGGIANLTLLSPGADPSGFDTGPGNALMDGWMRARRGEPFDRDGAWAASGRISASMLATLLADPYFSRPPPKSTGVEYFNQRWLEDRSPRVQSLAGEDVAATLCELSAQTIAQALERAMPGCQRLIVCGGGVHNRTLMSRLAASVGIPVESTERYGVAPDWVEAAAFAWLASRTLAGLPGNSPAVTGARQATVLGAIFPA